MTDAKQSTVLLPSIELRAYKNFLKKFKDGKYGSQRVGQAFYNEFGLHKINDQSALKSLYEKDGTHAQRLIKQLFSLT